SRAPQRRGPLERALRSLRSTGRQQSGVLMSFDGSSRQSRVASRSTGGVGVRKVVLYELLSLDGVAEDPDTFFTDWDEAMEANLAAVIATQDAVILGRRSYDEWSEFWPGSEIEPFATFINDVAKYVASSRPLGRQWHNATAIEGGLVQFVQNLKHSSG